MNRKLIKACALLLTLLLLSGCSDQSTSGILKTSDEEVGFFSEEVEIEKTKTISAVYTEDEIRFDDTYILKEGGNTYELQLTDVKTEPATVTGRVITLRYTKTFVDVDENDVPKEINVTYYDDGTKPTDDVVVLYEENGIIQNPVSDTAVLDVQMPADGSKTPENGSEAATLTPGSYKLELKTQAKGEPVWVDFAAPMSFSDYGAAYYRLSDGVYMPHSDSAPEVDGFEDEILSYLGLSPSAFRISYAVWNGEVYTDSSGVICRNAIMYGQRLADSLNVTYEGTVDLPDVQGYKATATYYYRGVVRNVKKVRTALLGGIAVLAVLLTSIIFLIARKKKRTKEKA